VCDESAPKSCRIEAIGWVAFIFATPICTRIASILIWRRAEQPARAPEAALGTS
jgi:hypothetical protein